jgi:hypothetical protein
MSVRRGPAIVLSLVLGAAALISAPSALASDGGNAKDGPGRKDCDRSSDVKLRVNTADGNSDRLVVVGAVFSDDDDYWSWKLKHGGDLSAQGEVKARDDIDRSFRVSRTMLNFDGTDTVTFRAENERTGEVCKVDVDF